MKQITSKALSLLLVGIIVGQVVGSFAMAATTIGTGWKDPESNRAAASIDSINVDGLLLDARFVCSREGSNFLDALVRAEAFINILNPDNSLGTEVYYNQFFIGTSTSTKTHQITDFVLTDGVTYELRAKSTCTRGTEIYHIRISVDLPDTFPPLISLTKTDGNEVSIATVGISITDKSGIDSYTYKAVRDSLEIIPETLVDLANPTSYSTTLSWSQSEIGIGAFTVYVKAIDTLGYESAWSSIGVMMLGDDDEQSPTISFSYNTKDMITGNAWADNIPDKSIGWSVTDASGLYSVAVYPIVNGIMGDLFSTSASGFFPINDIGTFALYVEATDNDFDNANPLDRTSGSATSNTKVVIDDDTDGPSISITDLTLPTGEPATIVIGWAITDLDGISSYWSDTFIPYPIFTDASGVSSVSAYLEKDGILINSWTGLGSIDTISIELAMGDYHFHIDATNGDDDRLSDSESSSHDISFTVVDDDESGPTILLVAEEIPFVGAQIGYTIYDIPSGVMSWNMTITRNGEFYKSAGETFSSANYVPIVGGLTISERGMYHITITATNGDMDHEGDQETSIAEADVRVHDWTAPIIAYEGDFDQTDANPQIVNVTVTDPESGLESIYILFGMKLDVLEGWNPIADLLDLGFLGDILGLLDSDMIWIPVRLTSEDVIGDLFDAVIEALLGDYLGSDITDLIIEAIESYIGESIEDFIGDAYTLIMEYFGDLIGEGFDWLNEQFATLVTTILGAVYDFVLGLLLDEDFVAGQTTYSYSIDMKYFAWARLFGEFRLLTIATNTEDLSILLTTSIEFSNRYSLQDDDTELSVGNFQIFGDAENLYVTFEENDYSGIAYLITIDDIPVLPCLGLYTAEKVDGLWTITFSRCPINILQALGISDLGSHTMTFYVMDLDSDWFIPYLFDAEFGIFELEFELIVPEISVLYTGDGTDGNAGQIIFSITDDSSFTILSGQLVNDLEVQIDTPQTFCIHVIDVFGNQACKSVTMQLVDDDTEAPAIIVVYTGDGTDGNSGTLEVSASDASGLSVDPSGIYAVSNELGTYIFEFTAVDADMDRAGDTLSTTITVEITIVDDDTTVDIASITVSHDLDVVSVSFTDIDYSGIATCDWVDVDGEAVAFTYSAGLITFENIWSLELGDHLIEFQLTDADNDRLNDATSAVFTATLTITEDDVVAWADRELEELIGMCMDCDCWTKKNHENTMINKLNEVIALKEAGNYECAYSKLLHDIKPKLTGLKMDELGNTYGNADFKNAWVCADCFGMFEDQIDPILAALHLLF